MLDAIINKILFLDPEMADKVSAFEGRVIAIELKGLGKTFYLLPQASGLKLTYRYEGEPDTTLSGTPIALFKMGLLKDVAPLMLKGEVEITGDVRLGRAFKKVLGELDIDWEEQLSGLIGDEAAHHLASITHRISSWGKKAGASVVADVSEYLQEESRDVVSGAELESFYEDVDRLRLDVDRFQARLDALKNKKEQH